MSMPTERPMASTSYASRFFGGPPLSVIFRLMLLSILVGVILKVLGLDPLQHPAQHRGPCPRRLEHGLRRHRVAVALFPARRADRRADLAGAAPHARAARTVGLFRPGLRGHRGGVEADQFVEPRVAAALQRSAQFGLDLVDQRKSAEDQRAVELHQAGAGANLGERGRARNRCRRRRSAGTHLRPAHRSPPACALRAQTADGPKARPPPSRLP